MDSAFTYPIDGYSITGIRRLLYLEMVLNGALKGNAPISGAQKELREIKLNLFDTDKGDSLKALPTPDPIFQKSISTLFPNLDESYSICIMDITKGRPVRYAARQEDRGFQPGSVGKLAVLTGFFTELAKIYPYSFEERRSLLKSKMVRSGKWGLYDEHTVPFFNPETKTLTKRQVQAKDIFSLYEWIDHMVSVSNNGAASIVWREAILMRTFGTAYPLITEEQADSFFQAMPKSELSEIARMVVNDPLRALGISEDEWRLGQLFTSGGTSYIPPKGGSIGSPQGLMKWMLALERGAIVDVESSLEMKRLLYMTDRRIRYAANNSLRDAAVYFKSGSLYKCDRTTMPDCGKYQGNVQNFMNSVAIVEHTDGTTYLVALMSNVLRKNSNIDHNVLAGRIDKIVAQYP
ncbi:MAG: hypothetical protein KDC53_18490 [Saprospiraceae bacterium]|nr:hypothetical protein [Saprospiraceae bacterium]